jgi:hypothetical integral membrane protein (TIGR02206 family)
MLLAEMSYYWRILYIGNETGMGTLMDKLPLQVCQWGLICMVFTMLTESDVLFGINFYVTLALSILAMSIPVVLVYTGPRYFRYYQFWLEHCMPYVGVFYMMFVRGKRPKYWHLWLSEGMLILLSIPCLIANRIIPGSNYMYLGNFTEGGTEFADPAPFLPKTQVLRYLSLIAITIALFHVLYFVERFIERRVQRKKSI